MRPQSARKGWEGLAGGAWAVACRRQHPTEGTRAQSRERLYWKVEGGKTQTASPHPQSSACPLTHAFHKPPPSSLEHPGKGSPLPTVTLGWRRPACP